MNMLLYKFLLLYQKHWQPSSLHGKNIISYKNSKFKILAPTCNNKFELTDESFSTHQVFKITLSS